MWRIFCESRPGVLLSFHTGRATAEDFTQIAIEHLRTRLRSFSPRNETLSHTGRPSWSTMWHGWFRLQERVQGYQSSLQLAAEL